jgi:hypothetical protein
MGDLVEPSLHNKGPDHESTLTETAFKSCMTQATMTVSEPDPVSPVTHDSHAGQVM